MVADSRSTDHADPCPPPRSALPLLRDKVMEGMATNVRPSRPEITDIVNAVYDGADGLVLMQVRHGATYASGSKLCQTSIMPGREALSPRRTLFGAAGLDCLITACAYFFAFDLHLFCISPAVPLPPRTHRKPPAVASLATACKPRPRSSATPRQACPAQPITALLGEQHGACWHSNPFMASRCHPGSEHLRSLQLITTL